jgi:hypothetical protein
MHKASCAARSSQSSVQEYCIFGFPSSQWLNLLNKISMPDCARTLPAVRLGKINRLVNSLLEIISQAATNSPQDCHVKVTLPLVISKTD